MGKRVVLLGDRIRGLHDVSRYRVSNAVLAHEDYYRDRQPIKVGWMTFWTVLLKEREACSGQWKIWQVKIVRYP